MTRKLKPVVSTLPDDIREAVLALPVKKGDQLLTVQVLLENAMSDLALANEAVRTNALAQMAADMLMKKQKRRGEPAIQAGLDGSLMLVIRYGEEEEPEDVLRPTPKLPSLDTLREHAKTQGVDISDLGRRKKAIIQRLGMYLNGSAWVSPQ